jgi:hypothetical protein
MADALVTAGFFLAMTAALQFSSWVEVWLGASSPPATQSRPPFPMSSSDTPEARAAARVA